MTRALVFVAVVAGAACQRQSAVTTPVPTSGLGADIAWLASPNLAGRQAGMPGADSAAVYIARRYEELSLHGLFRNECPSTARCPRAFFQFFTIEGRTCQNVAVVIDGSDPSLGREFVIIGAHYDHLGRSSRGAADRDLGDVVHPGADDNASGTAAVLELARRLAARPPRRSVALVNFDAEELGLVGSRVFVEHPPIALDSIRLMLNLDMVGRLSAERLYVQVGREKLPVRAFIDSAAAASGLHAELTSAISGRSDHASFAAKGVDVVALFTGFHSDYHKATDVASRINVPGLARVVDVAEAIARFAADR